MRRTNIYLEERQCRALELRAKREGVSRAELVRRYVDEGLERPDVVDLEGDLAAITATAGAWKDRAPQELPRRGDRTEVLENLWRDD